MAELNKGFNMDAYEGFRQKVMGDPSHADRDKTAVARWVQGEKARVTVRDAEVIIGADDGLNMMEMLLASYAACDAAMVALHASFMGLKVNSLAVEANGQFNVAAYLGIEDAPGPGYSGVTTRIYLDAPDATPEQIAHLIHICETASPVGDTLTRNVPVTVEMVANGERVGA